MLDRSRLGVFLLAFSALTTQSWAQGVTVSLSPAYAQLVPGQSLSLIATVAGSQNTDVKWQVDNVDGGTTAAGTVSADGKFIAPGSVPALASATITAVSLADPTASATATVTLLGQPATGSTYFVAPNGNDANSGTASSPFRTIQHAAGIAAAGDTVLVRQGTYNELVAPASSGNASQGYVTISAYPGETATIDGTGLPIPGGQNGLVTLKNASCPTGISKTFSALKRAPRGNWPPSPHPPVTPLFKMGSVSGRGRLPCPRAARCVAGPFLRLEAISRTI